MSPTEEKHDMPDIRDKTALFAGIVSVDAKPLTEAEEEAFLEQHEQAIMMMLDYMETGIARNKKGEVVFVYQKPTLN